MADDFKTVDVVMLKSGGELMTVTTVHDNGEVHVVLHSGGKQHEAEYPADVLINYKDPDPSDLEPD